MSSPQKWLPPIIPYADYGGNSELFIEAVYCRFKADFLDELDKGQLTFDGIKLSLRRHPLVKGKETSFWHLVSEGTNEEDRLLDFDRCECVGWARAVIRNANDPLVKRWENTRGTNTNVCLLLESEGYLVILGKRTGYYILLTAYFVGRRKLEKLLEEYKKYRSGLKA